MNYWRPNSCLDLWFFISLTYSIFFPIVWFMHFLLNVFMSCQLVYLFCYMFFLFVWFAEKIDWRQTKQLINLYIKCKWGDKFSEREIEWDSSFYKSFINFDLLFFFFVPCINTFTIWFCCVQYARKTKCDFNVMLWFFREEFRLCFFFF